MKSFSPPSKANANRTNSMAQRVSQPTKSIVNNRPSAIAQRKLQQVIQAKFYKHGDWMQDVSDQVITSKFSATTASLWKALKSDNLNLFIDAAGSGADYCFSNRTISISRDWFTSIENYVKKDEKDDKLLRATAALTHEMSHAHDHLIVKKSPEGADRNNGDWVLEVLKTELKAWMKEARSAVEHNTEKNISMCNDDDKNLIGSWIALKFITDSGKDYTALTNNTVVNRLKKYYNDNKPTNSSSLTLQYLTINQLDPLIKDYALQIRNKHANATDQALKPYVTNYMH